MAAYYNEIDPKSAAWLRELIKRNLIAPGEVDERSIVDVEPADVRGFAQCHWFAGIGTWSYALRLAGWSDDRLVWTGSCPCQPFSAAGKGEGKGDAARHLWPAWGRLIGERRPPVILGEQVGAAIGYGWLDDVFLSLEQSGYACGAAVFPACSVGAPHIRSRLYFVAKSKHVGHTWRLQASPGTQGWRTAERGVGSATECMADARNAERRSGAVGRNHDHAEEAERREGAGSAGECRVVGELADAASMGPRGRRAGEAVSESGAVERLGGLRDAVGMEHAAGDRRLERRAESGGRGTLLRRGQGFMGDAAGERFGEARDGSRRPEERAGDAGEPEQLGGAIEPGLQEQRGDGRVSRGEDGAEQGEAVERAGAPTNGFWADAEWIACRDGKSRPIMPGTSVLAHGYPARVACLRGLGNAVVAPQAEAFIRAYLDVIERG